MDFAWHYEASRTNWEELSELYRIAPLSEKLPSDLEFVFNNSRSMCFIYDGIKLIGAGRALADGRDCSYICDISVNPSYQGHRLGTQIVQYLVEQSKGHRKIILYAEPGKEGFYAKSGFKKLNTAMAIFENEEEVMRKGTISES